MKYQRDRNMHLFGSFILSRFWLIVCTQHVKFTPSREHRSSFLAVMEAKTKYINLRTSDGAIHSSARSSFGRRRDVIRDLRPVPQ
jgi:hypothetical protein